MRQLKANIVFFTVSREFILFLDLYVQIPFSIIDFICINLNNDTHSAKLQQNLERRAFNPDLENMILALLSVIQFIKKIKFNQW